MLILKNTTIFQIVLTSRVLKLEDPNFGLLFLIIHLKDPMKNYVNVLFLKGSYEHFYLGVDSAPPAPNKLARHPPLIGLKH